MKHKLLLLYSWLIRTTLFFLPDIPLLMRFRGWLYSFGMKRSGYNFQVSHNVILNSLEALSVGDNVYLAMNSVFLLYEEVDIGNNVMFGPNCVLTAGNHTFFDSSYRYGKSQYEKIVIGDGSWIAAQCVILPGSCFPAASILAAGSVLTSKLTESKTNSLYGGIPAKWIKSK